MSYSYMTWKKFFTEYFTTNPLTDTLRTYLEYVAYWWFTDDVHHNIQKGLASPMTENIKFIIEGHRYNLSTALVSDPSLLQTLMNSHRFLNGIAKSSALNNTEKGEIYTFYISLINTFPDLLKKNVTFNIETQPYLATMRAQTWMNLRDMISLNQSVKQEIAETIGLDGLYLDIWNEFSVLVIDNNGFDSRQLEVIYDLLNKIPKTLHELGSITCNDFLGNTGERYLWFSTKMSINIFSIRVGAIQENGFPNDVEPKYSDIFTLALVHEINHAVNAYLYPYFPWFVTPNPNFRPRLESLIARAGNNSMNYLRSMFENDFFIKNPQEFFASISNQWFSDSYLTLELALTRFNDGYLEPINQFLFFADAYSQGGMQTLFYTLDTKGNITREVVPITRDAYGHINSIRYNGTLYYFTLDQNGNVLKVSLNLVNQFGPMLDSKVLDALSDQVCFIYANPNRMTRAVATYDVASGRTVYGMCDNSQNEVFDTNPNYVDQSGHERGRLLTANKTILFFGGPNPHWSVSYYENVGLTPVKFFHNTSEGTYNFVTQSDETVASLPTITDFEHEDVFVMEVFEDLNDNTIFIFYGFDWKGTWAAGMYMHDVLRYHLDSLVNDFYVYHWIDYSGDGVPQWDEIHLEYTMP